MLERFLHCFKQKTSAVSMVYTCMFFGCVGMIYFGLKMQGGNADKFDLHFFIISSFHVIISWILMMGIIWEKPLLVLTFEFSYISVLTSLVVFTTICTANPDNWVHMVYIGLFISAMCYWLGCIHVFYRQMRLKMKSSLEYIDGDVYGMCNKLYENKHVQI
ncbi:uncharacterized protein [Euwallacea similis]|uniref:uncharacterized protein n=1 Tax=Euwallacea similis TaxID=1736056 RepID=UPI00344F19A9